MKGIIVESPIFDRNRQKYLSDGEYRILQNELLANPKSGVVMQATGGLRKIRVSSKGKGKRGGARVIYYYFDQFHRFYLLTIFAKNEVTDLTENERKQLKQFMKVWKDEQA